jgi:dynein heavy chain, axonemal
MIVLKTIRPGKITESV